jgi:hypothetical protein
VATSEGYNLVPPSQRPREPGDATQKLAAVLITGVLLLALGYGIFKLAARVVASDPLDGTGAALVWAWTGLIVGIVGTALVFVGLVGFGVKLGREAARV